jgi:hypothetical protein
MSVNSRDDNQFQGQGICRGVRRTPSVVCLPPSERLCRNRKTRTNVILRVSEESRISCRLRSRDPSAEFILSEAEGPQDDVATQSPNGEDANARGCESAQLAREPKH